MANKDNTFLNANSIYEEVKGEAGKSLDLEFNQQTNLVGIIKNRFQQAQDARQTDETRWLKAYENYRGLYNKSVKFRDSEKSRIFVKITKTKVLAAYGQLIDVIFGTSKFPIGISETKVPEGELATAHLDIQVGAPGIESTMGGGELPDNIGNRIEDKLTHMILVMKVMEKFLNPGLLLIKVSLKIA
jgi:hypothetical protein